MSVLSNSRHELFCQELAKGKTADEAYQLAGFKPNRGNATRLKAKESIAARLKELQEAVAEVVAEETGIDRARVLSELSKLAMAPVGHEFVRAADKRAALVDYARIEGWVIERTETGKPGDFDRMGDNELEAFIASRKGRVGEGVGRTGKANGQAGVRAKSNGIH